MFWSEAVTAAMIASACRDMTSVIQCVNHEGNVELMRECG